MDLPEGFYKDVEKQSYLKHILYSDTDSIFICVPHKDSSTLEPTQMWDIASFHAEKINENIIDYTQNVILNRCNIQPIHNRTDFKTELVMSAAMFLDVKKNYAYKLIVKEGSVLNPPKVNYTGIQVVRTNAPKLTQKLLREMIENIVLNDEIPRDKKAVSLISVVDNIKTEFDQKCNDYIFREIGIPGKWGKAIQIINGMKLYNHIMGQQVFSPGSAGLFIYGLFKNAQFGENIDIKNTNGICVPYEYDVNHVKERLTANGIYPDSNTQWDKILSTTCQRVIQLAKLYK